MTSSSRTTTTSPRSSSSGAGRPWRTPASTSPRSCSRRRPTGPAAPASASSSRSRRRGILIGNVVAFWFIDRLTVYGGYRASFLITAAGVALCAVSPNLAIGCIGAVTFGIGNGIGLVCNMTLIQQVVSDDRRGQIFAVLGSLVQTFTLVGTLAGRPDHGGGRPAADVGHQCRAPRGGFLNAVIVSAVRRTRRDQPTAGVIVPIEAGGETPGAAFERIATLLDEVERAHEREAAAGLDCTRAGRAAAGGAAAETSQPVVRPETRSWFSAWPMRCSSCQRSPAPSPASSFSSSAWAASSCAVRAGVVDLAAR